MDEVPISADEAARRLGVSRRHIYDLLSEGKLSGYQVGRRRVVDPVSVGEFLARNRITPSSLSLPRQSRYRPTLGGRVVLPPPE